MNDTIIELISTYGYFAVFFLIFIENVFPPIPSEVILLFGGSLAIASGMSIPLTIACATLGSVIGAVMLYYIGYKFNAERLKEIFSGRIGKITRIKPEYIDRSEKWFTKYQNKAVLLCRCVPLVRSFISVPAGFSKMKLPAFIALTVIGSTVWNAVLIFAGVALEEAWVYALPYFERYSKIVLVAAVVVIAGIIVYNIIRKKHRKSRGNDE